MSLSNHFTFSTLYYSNIVIKSLFKLQIFILLNLIFCISHYCLRYSFEKSWHMYHNDRVSFMAELYCPYWWLNRRKRGIFQGKCVLIQTWTDRWTTGISISTTNISSRFFQSWILICDYWNIHSVFHTYKQNFQPVPILLC